MVTRRRAVQRRLAGRRRVQARARRSRCRRRSAIPTSRPTSNRSSSPRWRRIPTTATRPPTTCAPTCCASGAAARSPPRPSPRSSPRCRRPPPRPRPPAPTRRPMATPTRRRPRPAASEGAAYATQAPQPRARHDRSSLLALAAIIGGDPVRRDEARRSQGTRHRAERRRQEREPGDEAISKRSTSSPTSERVADAATVEHRGSPEPRRAAASVEKDSTVTLFVSTGAAQKRIPLDIVNKSFTDAKNELTRLGFVVASEDKASDTVAEGFRRRQPARTGNERVGRIRR